MPAQEVIRKHGIANGTFYRWKEKFSGMEISDVKRLRELEAVECKAEAAARRDATRQDRAVRTLMQKKWCSRAQRRSCRRLFAAKVFNEPTSSLSISEVQPQVSRLSSEAS